jgi:hypothetical protein
MLISLFALSLFIVACNQDNEPEVKSTYQISFSGWEDSAAYFINYTEDPVNFGYDTFYHNFEHSFEAYPSEVDSLYFDVTDTLKRYLEVIFTVDGKEVHRVTEQANIGFLRVVWQNK